MCMQLSATRFGIAIFGIMTFGITIFSITTFSIMIRKCDTLHNDA